MPTFIGAGQYRRQLSPGEIVVVVSTVGDAGMLWQAQSDFYMRIAGGYINQGINHRTDLPPSVAALADPTAAHVERPSLEDGARLGLERYTGAHLVPGAATARRVDFVPGIQATVTRRGGEAAAVLRVGQTR